MKAARLASLVALAACTSGKPASTTAAPSAMPSAASAASAMPSAASAASAMPSAAAPPPAVPSEPERLTFDASLAILHLDAPTARTRAEACGAGDEIARVRCLLEGRYAEDRQAFALADELWTRFGAVAGVEEPQTMDGGYRGMIRIVPELPVGAERKHLGWVVAALRDFDAFFTWLGAPPDARPYRYRAIAFRFLRSVAKRTPTAYAHDWTIGYNLAGSLLLSEDAARETLFHEMFHLNDGARSGWSTRALDGIYDGLVQKCHARAACLAPNAPTDTMVRGGTYYAFQPGNDVREYGAELALRYYREQRAVSRGARSGASARFKCGPAPNPRAWALMRDEFFGGVDRTGPCP